jgi:hypothetical protein
VSDERQGEFVAYPRGAAQVAGTAEQLKSLAEGYFALLWLFVASIPLMAGVMNVNPGGPSHDGLYTLFVQSMLMLGLGILTGSLSIKPCRKIAFGMGWSPAVAAISSVCIGASVMLCIGFIPFSFIFYRATRRIMQFGVKRRFLWHFRMRDVQAALDQMRSSEPPPTTDQITPGPRAG